MVECKLKLIKIFIVLILLITSFQSLAKADDIKDFEIEGISIGAENIAACIVEPVAGSTGTLVPPKGYLQRLREICDKHGILLIFDEVITGWGRMGEPFAAQAFGVTPDMMTMAKAVTNGEIGRAHV